MDLFGCLPSGGGGAQFLTRLLGQAKALEFMLSAKPVSPSQALAIGLVNQILPDGDVEAAALEFAADVAQKAGRIGVTCAKRAVFGAGSCRWPSPWTLTASCTGTLCAAAISCAESRRSPASMPARRHVEHSRDRGHRPYAFRPVPGSEPERAGRRRDRGRARRCGHDARRHRHGVRGELHGLGDHRAGSRGRPVGAAATGLLGHSRLQRRQRMRGIVERARPAVHAVESGRAEVVLVVGVEKLYGPDRSDSFRALNGAVNTEYLATAQIRPEAESVFVARIYPERLEKYRASFGLCAHWPLSR